MSVESSLEGWIEDLAPRTSLTKSHKRVVDVLVSNLQLASYADIPEIADRAMVNGSTVVRCAQALGFKGWPDLQQELRARFLASLSSEETLTVHSGGTESFVHDSMRRDIDNLRRAQDTVDAQVVNKAVQRLSAAGKILTVGMGSLAAPATLFAHLASTMGYSATFEGRGGVHAATAVAGLGPGDVLLLCNVWRQHRSSVEVVEAAANAGVTVVLITDIRKGRLKALSDYVIVVPSEGLSFFQSVTAATSVIYGLLAGMQHADPERTGAAIRRVQQLWQELGSYVD